MALIGGTTTGRDFTGRVAVPSHTGLTADCTELDVDEDGQLVARRPIFGGDVLATIICLQHRPQMATVRPGLFDPRERDPDREGEIEVIPVVPEEADTLTEVLEREVGEVTVIMDADVLGATGRRHGGRLRADSRPGGRAWRRGRGEL